MCGSSKFFQNMECEYFPCHEVEEGEELNCMFCYCPLYMLKGECGGDFKYTNGFKDCSECMIPHSKDAYQYIMSHMTSVLIVGCER